MIVQRHADPTAKHDFGRSAPPIGTPVNPAALSVRELAHELGVFPTTMRAWMRRQGWRSLVDHGQPWLLNPDQAAQLRGRFGGSGASRVPVVPDAPDIDPLSELTVGELLASYRNVLASLRSRGLVRTNNAPIGDLAEYCAAVVYDGLLAPNSAKSFDLVAEDGRRIQVKVRLVRPDTSRSAVFSPIRSFGFDACLFLLVDDEASEVELARELSVEEVREHGSFRKHTNGVVLRIGQVRTLDQCVELTEQFREAWREILDQHN